MASTLLAASAADALPFAGSSAWDQAAPRGRLRVPKALLAPQHCETSTMCAETMQWAHMVSAMPPAAIAASLASERFFVMVLDGSKPENLAAHRQRGTQPPGGPLFGIHMSWLRTSSACPLRRTSSASRFVQRVNGSELFSTSRRTSNSSR